VGIVSAGERMDRNEFSPLERVTKMEPRNHARTVLAYQYSGYRAQLSLSRIKHIEALYALVIFRKALFQYEIRSGREMLS